MDAADKEILAEAERLDVKAMGPLILSELLFDHNIRQQIKKYKRHFLRVSRQTPPPPHPLIYYPLFMDLIL